MCCCRKAYGVVYCNTGVNEGRYDSQGEWVVAKNMAKYAESFKQLAGEETKISGSKARSELVC